MKNRIFVFILTAIILSFCFFAVACTPTDEPSSSSPSSGSEQTGQQENPSGSEQPSAPSGSSQPNEPNESKKPSESNQENQDNEITKMYITIGGNKKEITLEKNSSVDALVGFLKADDISFTASDYGGFEKVGGLGRTLPTNHSQLTTQPGDVILYQTNQIVLFYGSNSWSYTRIGKIAYSSLDELKSFLGAGQGSVKITLSLN